MTSYTTRILCQVCHRYFQRISHHVRNEHHTTITDLIADGKWINERNTED